MTTIKKKTLKEHIEDIRETNRIQKEEGKKTISLLKSVLSGLKMINNSQEIQAIPKGMKAWGKCGNEVKEIMEKSKI